MFEMYNLSMRNLQDEPSNIVANHTYNGQPSNEAYGNLQNQEE